MKKHIDYEELKTLPKEQQQILVNLRGKIHNYNWHRLKDYHLVGKDLREVLIEWGRDFLRINNLRRDYFYKGMTSVTFMKIINEQCDEHGYYLFNDVVYKDKEQYDRALNFTTKKKENE